MDEYLETTTGDCCCGGDDEVAVADPAPAFEEPAAVETVAIGGYDPYGAADPAEPVVAETVSIGGYSPYGVATADAPAADTGNTFSIGGYNPYAPHGVAAPAPDPVALPGAGAGAGNFTVGGGVPFDLDPGLGGISSAQWDGLSDEQKIAGLLGVTVDQVRGMWSAPDDPNVALSNQVVNGMLTQEALKDLYAAQWGLNNTQSPLYHGGDDLDPASPYYWGNNPHR